MKTIYNIYKTIHNKLSESILDDDDEVIQSLRDHSIYSLLDKYNNVIRVAHRTGEKPIKAELRPGELHYNTNNVGYAIYITDYDLFLQIMKKCGIREVYTPHCIIEHLGSRKGKIDFGEIKIICKKLTIRGYDTIQNLQFDGSEYDDISSSVIDILRFGDGKIFTQYKNSSFIQSSITIANTSEVKIIDCVFNNIRTLQIISEDFYLKNVKGNVESIEAHDTFILDDTQSAFGSRLSELFDKKYTYQFFNSQRETIETRRNSSWGKILAFFRNKKYKSIRNQLPYNLSNVSLNPILDLSRFNNPKFRVYVHDNNTSITITKDPVWQQIMTKVGSSEHWDCVDDPLNIPKTKDGWWVVIK